MRSCVSSFFFPVFPSLFFFITPAMQSTLGTAGASCHPQGVLNGALAEQTPGLIWIASFLLRKRGGEKVQTLRGLKAPVSYGGVSIWRLPRCLLAVKPVQENPSDIIVIVN
jgi:hypothetical protein